MIFENPLAMEEKRQTLAEQQIYLVDERVFMQKSLPPQVEPLPNPQHQAAAESNSTPNEKSKKCLICANRKHVTASIISLAALLALIIILAVLLAHDGYSSGAKSATLVTTLAKMMKVGQAEFPAELGIKYCGNIAENTFNQQPGKCLTNNGGFWISFRNQSNEWREISSALETEEVETLAVSPHYIVPKKACSLSLISDDIQLVAAVSLNSSQTFHLTSLGSQWFQIKDVFNGTDRIQLIVQHKTDSFQPIWVVFHGCYDYTPVEKASRSAGQPDTSFRSVQPHQYDRCSLEFHESGKVHCDWWKLTSRDDQAVGEFDWIQGSGVQCLKQGLESNPQGAKYFMKFSGVNKSAYLVSPLFSADSSKELLYSLHAAIICDGSELRAYVVPENFNLFTAVSETTPFLRLTEATANWKFETNSTTIPNEYPRFHVLLEAVVLNNGSCGKTSFCELPGTVAIDEIVLEMNSPKCAASGMINPIDTDFEGDDIDGWIIDNQMCEVSEEIASDTGNTSNHVLVCTVYNRDAEFMLRSSLLRANSNCSCVLHFSYQIESLYMLPVFLTQKFGNDTTQHDKKQKILWSEKLNSSKDWQEAKVNIKLVASGESFILEFNEIGMDNLQHHFRLDNLRFENCDFSIVVPGSN